MTALRGSGILLGQCDENLYRTSVKQSLYTRREYCIVRPRGTHHTTSAPESKKHWPSAEKISAESEMNAMSTTKSDLLKIIRRKCLDCVCFQPREVVLCPTERCALWPYRMGKDPYKTPRQMSDAQRKVLAEARQKAVARKLSDFSK